MPARHQPLVDVPKLPPPCEYGEAIMLAERLPDDAARRRLIEGHLRLALRTATDFSKQWHEDLENCFSVAQVALVTAVDKFDFAQSKDIYAFIQQRIEWRLKDYIDGDRQYVETAEHQPKTINIRELGGDPWKQLWEHDDESPKRRTVRNTDRTIREQTPQPKSVLDDARARTLIEILDLCDDQQARMVAELINHDGKVAPVARVMGVTEYTIRKWRAELRQRFDGTPRQQTTKIFRLLFPNARRKAV